SFERLVIETAFPGDDEIGPGDRVGESDPCGDEIKTGNESRPEKDHGAESETSGGPRAGGARGRFSPLARRGDESGEAVLVEGKGLGGDALLRSVDRGAASRTEQGIGDITGHDDLGKGDSVRRFDAGEAVEILGRFGER